MYKKAILTVLIAVFVVFSAGFATAGQVDGLASNNGPDLPSMQDVYVNPGALGDALINGYYNARGAFNFLRVVNTSSQGVAVKIRFREGDDSNEILDFFICMSPKDQWTAWIIGDETGTNPASLVWYDDDTPTYPDPQDDNDVTNNMFASVSFKYSSTGAASVVSADDTNEGYYEILGVVAYTPGEAVKTPYACGELLGNPPMNLQNVPNDPKFDFDTDITDIGDVPNAIFGAHVIIDIGDLIAQTYALNMTAFADCRQGAPVANISLATEGKPLFNDCDDTIDGVNYALTKANTYALYDIEASLAGRSDIINVFPTRRESIKAGMLGAHSPFNSAAVVDSKSGKVCIDTNDDQFCSASEKDVCEPIPTKIYDDAEHTPTKTGFSPGKTSTPEKCHDVNYVVVGVDNSPLLNTALLSYKIDASSYEIGWVSEDFVTGASYHYTTMGVDPSVRSYGMPVLAYELGAFGDGWLEWMLPLRYDTNIVYLVQ